MVAFLLVAGTVSNSRAECEDYSPCVCGQDALGNLYVNCIDVLPVDIQVAFNKTTAQDIYSLVLILPAAGGNIPADLLSGKRALIIDLLGPNSDFQLVMDPAAIRSSSNYTKQLVISKCNLSLMDFTFLRGFARLEELRLDYATNIKPVEKLPPLVSLSGLTIDNSRGFEALVDFPAIAFSRLSRLYLYNDDLNDESLAIILNAFVSAPSASATLEVLALGNNRITRAPEQIGFFPSILDVALTKNNISLITAGAFSLSAPGIRSIYLNNNSLNAIEPNSFQGFFRCQVIVVIMTIYNLIVFVGDFSRAQIQLSFNDLTELDALVFQTVLTQMIQVENGNGTIYLESSTDMKLECKYCKLHAS